VTRKGRPPEAGREPTPEGGVGVNVRMSRSRPSTAVVDDLQAAGLHVERVLQTLNVVSGTVPADRFDRLSAVDGVTSVERDHVVHMAARPA
jgi:hypothetical protein